MTAASCFEGGFSFEHRGPPLAAEREPLGGLNAKPMFIVEDEIHAEWIGQFRTIEDAMALLRRLATVPWGEAPNLAPCGEAATCSRAYDLVEYDDAATPWTEIRRTKMLEVTADGATWLAGA